MEPRTQPAVPLRLNPDAPRLPRSLRLLFTGPDGHVYLSEGGSPHPTRLSFAPDDFGSALGIPAWPGAFGEYEESLVFVHATPSPDGKRVAAFAVRPCDDEFEVVELAVDGLQWTDVEEHIGYLEVPDEPEVPDDVAGLGFVAPQDLADEIDEDEIDDEELDGYWPGATVYVLDRDGVSVTEAWSFETGSPTHVEWAPDGRHLLVLHQEEDWLHLHLVDTHEPGSAQLLCSGAPVFWTWQPGGETLVVRVLEPGEELPRVLIGEPLRGGPLKPLGLAGRFYVPAWHPDGSSLVFAEPAEGEDRLILTDPTGESRLGLLRYPGRGAFAWDPAGRRLGLAVAPEGHGAFTQIEVLDIASDELRTLWQGGFVAWSWLPGGRSVVLCQADEESGLLRWLRVDLDGSTFALGPAFRPSPEAVVALHFFEQLGGSHPWLSADGRYLCAVGQPMDVVDGPGGTEDDPVVLVTAIDGGETVSVGQARFACFG